MGKAVPPPPPPPPDLRWNRIITGTLFNSGKGLGLGLLVSLLFFKRRSWPVVAGLGFGLGLSYGVIDRELSVTSTER